MNSGDSARDGLATFLVEHYWTGVTPDLFEDASARVRRSVEEIAGEDVRIRFLHSTLVPDEETAFCVFEAESVAAIEDAYARSEVRFERLVDALRVNAGAARPQQATTRGGDRE